MLLTPHIYLKDSFALDLYLNGTQFKTLSVSRVSIGMILLIYFGLYVVVLGQFFGRNYKLFIPNAFLGFPSY
jgi:hypothetical protein